MFCYIFALKNTFGRFCLRVKEASFKYLLCKDKNSILSKRSLLKNVKKTHKKKKGKYCLKSESAFFDYSPFRRLVDSTTV